MLFFHLPNLASESDDEEYTTIIDDNMEEGKDPPYLPPQLRYILLNAVRFCLTHSPSQVVDSFHVFCFLLQDRAMHSTGCVRLPMPLDVSVDHLCCSAIKDGLIVQAVTHKRVHSYTTVVYYSVMPAASTATPFVARSPAENVIAAGAGSVAPQAASPPVVPLHTHAPISLPTQAPPQPPSSTSALHEAVSARRYMHERLEAAARSLVEARTGDVPTEVVAQCRQQAHEMLCAQDPMYAAASRLVQRLGALAAGDGDDDEEEEDEEEEDDVEMSGV